ncbi:hypothetical protein FB451DRAFT_1269258 [Mycena latifolia]|nr:hypothetical protein FB451DRAFT_1269258 [Mycena latifolia]
MHLFPTTVLALAWALASAITTPTPTRRTLSIYSVPKDLVNAPGIVPSMRRSLSLTPSSCPRPASPKAPSSRRQRRPCGKLSPPSRHVCYLGAPLLAYIVYFPYQPNAAF